MYTRVCLLCLTFNCFCRFLANQRPSIIPPYLCPPIRMPTCGGKPFHPPHLTPHHTSNTRICLHTSADTHRYDIRTLICTMATDGSASAASEIELGSIYPTMLELRAAAAKQAANTCVARVVWCGMRRMDGVSPYVGIRIGGTGWIYGGSLIG